MIITYRNEHRPEHNELIALLPELLGSCDIYSSYSDIEISFPEFGTVSFVCMIHTNTEVHVLKIARSGQPENGEVLFLNTWRKAGVRTPAVLARGVFQGYNYFISEYIDAGLLYKKYMQNPTGLLADKVYVRMGEILAKIHSTSSQGYGRLNTNGIPEFETLGSWINSCYHTKKIAEVAGTSNFSKAQVEALAQSQNALLEIIPGTTTQSAFCHNDYSLGNIFASEPEFTVFDPNAMYCHPIFDLAKTYMLSALYTDDLPQIKQDLLEGYFGKELVGFDEALFNAALLFQIAIKLPNWMNKDRPETLVRTKEMIDAILID